MKISKNKATKIMATLGLTVGVLSGCSSKGITKTGEEQSVTKQKDYSDYRCKDKRKTDKDGNVLCTNSAGQSSYIPLAFIGSNGYVSSNYRGQSGVVNGNSNQKSKGDSKGSSNIKGGGSKGLGSGRGGASS